MGKHANWLLVAVVGNEYMRPVPVKLSSTYDKLGSCQSCICR